MIEVSNLSFLLSFEDFDRVLVPLENKLRAEKELPPLTEDEKTNLFLELRKKHGIT